MPDKLNLYVTGFRQMKEAPRDGGFQLRIKC